MLNKLNHKKQLYIIHMLVYKSIKGKTWALLYMNQLKQCQKCKHVC